jgi:hypothetical protein
MFRLIGSVYRTNLLECGISTRAGMWEQGSVQGQVINMYKMGTGGPIPGAEARPGRDADHLPLLVSRSRMSRSYTSSPTKRLIGV